MKKFLICSLSLLTALLSSCTDEDKIVGTLEFGVPTASQVTATTAWVRCTVTGQGEQDPTQLGRMSLVYGPAALDEVDYARVATGNPSQGAVETRLTNLTPETEYCVFLMLELDEGEALRSASARFATRPVDDTTPMIDVTGKKTIVAEADGGRYMITYEIVNRRPGEYLQVEKTDLAWVHSFDLSEDGSLYFQVDANTGDERTVLFNLTYPDAQPVTVTVIQEAGSGGGGDGGGEEEQQVVTLTRNQAWPSTYQNTTCTLGDYDFTVYNAAIYDSDNGIQFKSGSGYVANEEDMGPIDRIELVYAPRDANKNFVLYTGDSTNPQSNLIEAETVGGVHTFDCSATSPRYFRLQNGESAGYLYEIKIYTGEGGGGGGGQEEAQPTFGDLQSSGISQTGATLSCRFAYNGTQTISEAGFRYAAAGGTEEHSGVTPATGTYSVAIGSLTPSTSYTWYFYAVIGGTTYRSSALTFTTRSEGGGGGATGAYRTGWAELPVEKQQAGDYYYAYHMRDDKQSVRNYSVCYSKELGCPMWVAAPMHSSYKGSSGRNESYKQDPVIQSQGCTQVGKRTGYTRGHMLGSSDRTISVATNKQVFYYSNIGPQLQNGFNTGGGAWNNLEDWVDGQWCADTLYQVIGCHWENRNTKVDGTVIPTHYYKVLLRTKKGNSGKWVVDCTSSELKCAAFILEHKSQKGLEPSRNMMVSVAELENMTGFSFFPNVPNAPKSECNPSDWGL